jgi:hypothetical protein
MKNTTPSTIIASRAIDFVHECMAHGLSAFEMQMIISQTATAAEGHDARAELFVNAIRRNQVINKVHTTCELLRRGYPQEATEGDKLT